MKNLSTQEIVKYANSIIIPSSLCIDCGANIGQETISWARTGAVVHSFEPHPEAFAVLSDRTSNFENVHLYEKAVWITQAKIPLYMGAESYPGHEYAVPFSIGATLYFSKDDADLSRQVQVETIDLIEFISYLDKHITLLKLDIEGAEGEIVNRLIDTELYKKIDLIAVETHDHHIPETAEQIAQIHKKISAQNINNINLNWK